MVSPVDETGERPAIEQRLDVLARNKLVDYGAMAAALVGPLLFFGFLAKVFPPGVLGLHLAILGFLLRWVNGRSNMRPKRRSAKVRADREGVWVDGTLAVPRAKISDGFFQPRAQGGSYGSSVRLVDKRRRVLFEAESSEVEALALLRALGLDPGSKRAEFSGSSPVYATLGRSMLMTFGLMGLAMGLGIVMAALQVKGGGGPIPLLLVPFIFGAMIPSKIAVGVDGILVRWLWQKKFIPMAQISQVMPEGDRAIRVLLADGSAEVIYTAMHRRNTWRSYTAQHRDAVLARIHEALIAFRGRGPTADVSAIVGKGTRTRSEWLAALEKLRAAEGGYRDAVVRDEDLWRVVEDPAAPEDARAGAAMLLRRSLDEAGKARVRVAAEATASPRLRVVLDTAASEKDDAALAAALEEMAEGEGADAKRAAG
jgi:hypothetical protein